ncbi:ArnT family glycosyltransferase [Thermodesulfobacteriota bacterium]
MHSMRIKIKSLSFIPLVVICTVLFILGLKDIADEHIYSGDMYSYALNGIYFSDLFKDRPITNIIDYSIHYYAQYPALSIGHHAPFLSFIIGIFYLFTDYSIVTGKVVVFLFGMMGAVAWFLLTEKIFGKKIAFLSSLLIVTNPYIIKYFKIIMTEIPTMSMIILSAYLFYQYIELGKKNYAYSFAVCAALSIWTKQVAFFMLPVYLLYVLLTKKGKLLIQKEAVWSYIIILAIVSPFIIITFKYGVLNLQSLEGSPFARLNANKLAYHIKALYTGQLILPVLVLSIISMLGSIFTRDRRFILFFLWVIFCYFQMTYLRSFARDTIYWIPPLCLFAATSIEYIKWKIQKTHIMAAVLLALGAYQFFISYHTSPVRLKGFEEAAQYVIDNRKGNAVFFEGYHDPIMVYNIRKHDNTRDMIVLRGSKILATSKMRRTIREKMSTADEILTAFEVFGVKHIIIEDKSYEKVKIYATLRNLLKTDDFDLKKEIIVEGSDRGLRYHPRKLLVYEFNGDGIPKAGYLSMDLPIVGQQIKLPIDQIRLSNILP